MPWLILDAPIRMVLLHHAQTSVGKGRALGLVVGFFMIGKLDKIVAILFTQLLTVQMSLRPAGRVGCGGARQRKRSGSGIARRERFAFGAGIT
jgi:hypothetical protein